MRCVSDLESKVLDTFCNAATIRFSNCYICFLSTVMVWYASYILSLPSRISSSSRISIFVNILSQDESAVSPVPLLLHHIIICVFKELAPFGASHIILEQGTVHAMAILHPLDFFNDDIPSHHGVDSVDIGSRSQYLSQMGRIIYLGLGIRYDIFASAAAFYTAGFRIAPLGFLTDEHRVLIPLSSNSTTYLIATIPSACTASRIYIGYWTQIKSSWYVLITFSAMVAGFFCDT